MKSVIIFYVGAVVLFFCFLREYEAIPVEELPNGTLCGVYGEKVEPYLTGAFTEMGGELEGYAHGNKIDVRIKRVYTEMCKDRGEFPRYWVEVKFNDRVAFALGHTDVPFTINTYYKKVKYRVICVNYNQ
jgi:hypothetical protein